MLYLKYGFCNKVISERWNSDQLNTFATYLSSLLGGFAGYNDKITQKWGQICWKSVQLVRASSFRNDLLQNLYFSNFFKALVRKRWQFVSLFGVVMQFMGYLNFGQISKSRIKNVWLTFASHLFLTPVTSLL